MVTGIVSKVVPFSISGNVGRAKGLWGFAIGRSGLLISIGFTILFQIMGRPDMMMLFAGVSAFIFLWSLIKRLLKLAFILLALYGLFRIIQMGALPI